VRRIGKLETAIKRRFHHYFVMAFLKDRRLHPFSPGRQVHAAHGIEKPGSKVRPPS